MPRVVPWKDDQEIDQLKQSLYGNEVAAQKRALAKLRAYQTRGPVPHWIESTGYCVESQLNDVDRKNDLTYTSIRLSYAMSLIRFVNGLLDPIQKSQYVIPLTVLARKIDLPRSFVELRHVSTHEGLPSLAVLRDMNSRALAWLWDHYWSKPLASIDNTHKKNEIKELMREWRRIRRDDPTRVIKVGDTTKEGSEYWHLVGKIKVARDEYEEEFMYVLFFMNVLTFGGNGGVKKSQAVMRLFGPLLEVLNEDGFVERVVLYGLEVAQNSTPETDPQLVLSILEWLKFLTAKKKNSFISDFSSIIENCLETPTQINSELLEHLNGQGLLDDRVQRLTADMRSLLTSANSTFERRKRKIQEITEEVEEYRKRLVAEQGKSEGNSSRPVNTPGTPTKGWGLVENWSSRPIGVL